MTVKKLFDDYNIGWVAREIVDNKIEQQVNRVENGLDDSTEFENDILSTFCDNPLIDYHFVYYLLEAYLRDDFYSENRITYARMLVQFYSDKLSRETKHYIDELIH